MRGSEAGTRRAAPGPRSVAVGLHRYAGLTLAVFLSLAGVTGSIIAFEHELDAWLNPDLYFTQDVAAGTATRTAAAAVTPLPAR